MGEWILSAGAEAVHECHKPGSTDQPTADEVHEAEQVIMAIAPAIKARAEQGMDDAIDSLTPRQRHHNE
jgi:hypothetical protein